MNILVFGSLAYDRIMDFPGYFSEHILPEKIHILNVSFNVNSLIEKFGGAAGNIAYGLSVLGEKPIILATIGRDYHEYFEWLAKNKIACDNIRIVEEELTACAYITTDKADNQITGFNAGAMKYPASFDFDKLDSGESIAIIAPGNLEDMINYSIACKDRGIDYIFDPGQSLPMWDGRDLINSIKGSLVMISNDYELELIMNKTGLDKKGLLQRTNTIITTLGEQGSRVLTPDTEINIPAVVCREVVDPTGAGDAYRAGLIKGLIQGVDIEQSAKMGAVCSSFALECYGTQDYCFNQKEFEERLITVTES